MRFFVGPHPDSAVNTPEISKRCRCAEHDVVYCCHLSSRPASQSNPFVVSARPRRGCMAEQRGSSWKMLLLNMEHCSTRLRKACRAVLTSFSSNLRQEFERVWLMHAVVCLARTLFYNRPGHRRWSCSHRKAYIPRRYSKAIAGRPLQGGHLGCYLRRQVPYRAGSGQ